MEAANYKIKPCCCGKLSTINYNNAYIRFLYHKRQMIFVKNPHNTPMVDFEMLCNDKSNTKSDEIKIQKQYKIANFL